MKNKRTETCQQTGKSILSEAQASRKLNNYDDIKSYYKCQHCGGYHLTSRTNQQKFKILKDLLKKEGLYVSNKTLTDAVKTFKEWSCPISERAGKCLDDFQGFLKHYKCNYSQ